LLVNAVTVYRARPQDRPPEAVVVVVLWLRRIAFMAVLCG
jgi:hypothetical protein